jgi:predicted RNA-binding Zn ribbon-like protein
MRISRSRSVTGKVTDEEYARLEAFASPQKVSTWARDVLLRATEPVSVERELLAELLALRTIVVNVIFTPANGEAITTEAMRAIIDHADQEKTSRATERLATVTARDKA